MKVLMFGWEFPPYNSGGLGTACYGLTKGLSNLGTDVTFVIPRDTGREYEFLKVISSNMQRVKLRGIKSILHGYITSTEYQDKVVRVMGRENPNFNIYGENLMEEVARYSQKAASIAVEEEHDVIHAHDWLTYKAGLEAKRVSGKPLVVHVHATEFDRTGGNGVNQDVYDIERAGFWGADAIIAVSNYTKSKVVEHYGIDPTKISVVHNAIEPTHETTSSHHGSKTVLYLGRLTLQKGPDYFIEAAKKVLDVIPDATFIVAGTGDMEQRMIERTAQLGISDKVLFTGFLRENDINRAYQMADLYVLPSVSEPFGLTPLEAVMNKTPVLISKQSGVSEVLSNCLKVDFWDVNEMANKMVAVLEHEQLAHELSNNSHIEIKKMSWTTPAQKCIDLYSTLVNTNV